MESERGVVVVARKVGERVVIGEGPDRITIDVIKPKGVHSKLRIEAPRHVRIQRGETLEATS